MRLHQCRNGFFYRRVMAEQTTMPLRILMFAPHFPPRRGPEALVNGKLALAMMRRGWNLDVISEATKHPFERETDASFWDLLKEITRGVPVVFPAKPRFFLIELRR